MTEAEDGPCSIEGCANIAPYECGWCHADICGDHANTYSGLCPDCQQEYEDDQA